jgi:hypothetical protein
LLVADEGDKQVASPRREQSQVATKAMTLIGCFVLSGE